jgi:autotransporter-associated beta strand protein
MASTWWQKRANRANRSSRHSAGRTRMKVYRRLQLEWLENRLAPATHTWTGAASTLWSNAANWTGGSPAGDTDAMLVFPAGAMNLTNSNDLSGLTITSISFTGSDNYTISGIGITLNAGGIMLGTGATTGTDVIDLTITLGAAQTWTVTNPSRTLQVNTVISGPATAALTKDGMGELLLTADNTYTGTTTVAAGSLLINGTQPGSNVLVDSGATLGGSGAVGTLTTSGEISPGGPGPGILRSGNAVFNTGSSLVVQFLGTTPGIGFGELSVNGTTDLSGSPSLTVTLGSFVPSVGSTFTPLTSTGAITGTFSGLPNNSTLTVGGRMFTVTYQAGAVVLTVGTENTQTTLTSSANPSAFGQAVTFTATVTSMISLPMLIPTGTVTFMDGTTTLGTATLSSTGIATFTTSTTTPLSAGTHTITAVYGGDTNFTASTSAPLTQTVSAAASTTMITLSSSANPSVFGQPVTFTATVTAVAPATGTPTGTVTFSEGTTTLGTGILNSSGQATFQTSSLSVGTHLITATYSGDTTFSPSTTTSPLSQTVNLASTMTSLTSSLNPSGPGQSVTFTATVSPVSPAMGTPTGTVSFDEGTTVLGTATLTNGHATFSTSTLATGSHSITAVYSGDSDFLGSTSPILVQTVQQAASLNQAYVTQLYVSLLGRQPDSGGLTFWTNLLNQNRATMSQVALGFTTSQEFRMLEVQDVYQKYLHRSADSIGLSGWTQYLEQGHTLEQLEAEIVASSEYLQRRLNGTTDNFLATVIMDTFNRSVTQADRNLFGDDFGSYGDRRRAGRKIFATTEYQQDLVESYYQSYLDRSADPGGLNASVAALKNGVSDEMLIAVIVSSPEFVSTHGGQSTSAG